MLRRFTLKSDYSQKQADDPATNTALKRESKRLFIIALAAVILFVVLFAAIFIFRPGEVYGNTQGNLLNGGLFAESNGWIYYSSSNGKCLYKAQPDGSEKTKLADGLCYLINVTDGWIFYVDWQKGNLCKIRTDGTEFTKLDDSARQLYIENGWIYYTYKYLYKMRTDGSGKTQLSSSRVDVMNIYDGWIYFVNMSEDDSLRKMRMDGTGVTKLNVTMWPGIIDGDCIYYGSGPFLCKIKTDGTGQTTLSKELNQNFNISNGWVYYTNRKDTFMHKMRTDGTGDVKLNDRHTLFIYIAGDWIYYYATDDDVELYRMKLDGTENQQVD